MGGDAASLCRVQQTTGGWLTTAGVSTDQAELANHRGVQPPRGGFIAQADCGFGGMIIKGRQVQRPWVFTHAVPREAACVVQR